MGFWRQITIVLSLQLKHTENTLLEKFNHFNPLPKTFSNKKVQNTEFKTETCSEVEHRRLTQLCHFQKTLSIIIRIVFINTIQMLTTMQLCALLIVMLKSEC